MLKTILLPKSLGPLLVAVFCAFSNLMIFIYFISSHRWSLFPWLTVPGFNPTNCSLMTLYAVNSIHSVYFFAALLLIVSELGHVDKLLTHKRAAAI